MEATGQTLFVISDLHLGGGAHPLCPAAAQQQLARFIRRVMASHRAAHPAHLVLNGDIVDFLAEEPFVSFTASDAEATRKLAAALDSAPEVIAALAAHVESGAPLTLLLGNHDVELSLPGARSSTYRPWASTTSTARRSGWTPCASRSARSCAAWRR